MCLGITSQKGKTKRCDLHLVFSVLEVLLLAGLLIFFTESQNSRGWKGPLWVI